MHATIPKLTIWQKKRLTMVNFARILSHLVFMFQFSKHKCSTPASVLADNPLFQVRPSLGRFFLDKGYCDARFGCVHSVRATLRYDLILQLMIPIVHPNDV